MDKFWERYITSRPANSKGAFEAFAAANRDPEPRNMADGGRIGLDDGGFLDKALADYNTYLDMRKGRRKKFKVISFKTFFELYSKENRAEGGRIGFADGLTVKQQQKVVEAFPDIEFNFKEHPYSGVEKYPKNRFGRRDDRVTNKDWTKVDRFKKKGFTLEMGEGLNVRGKPYSTEGKRLTQTQQEFIKSNFELPEGVKEWDFSGKKKYGIKQTVDKRGTSKQLSRENLLARISRRLKEKRKWTVAADRGSTKGWMMLQMNRVYENEKAASKLRPGAKKFTYEPVFDIFDDGSKKGRQIIVGFKDNTKAGDGKVYYGLDKHTKKGAGDWAKHGDWKLNQKLVDISKRSGKAPNDVIMGLLKDRGFKNLDRKLKLDHLIHFLSGTEGTSSNVLKSAIARHHQSGVAFGSATDDLALTTRTINNKMKGIEKRIANNKILAADIQTLKNNNVYVRSPDGKLYGAGKQTPIGQFKQIESSVAKALETGTDFGGKKFDNQKMLKFFKDAGIPCIKGVGGDCNSIADYQKGYNKIVKEGAEGSAEAIQKLKGFTKAMRALTGAAKWTGYGLLAEAGFMVPFAIADYSTGESWKRILGNATDYGFGPILGQSEFEEFKAALPEGSFAVEGEKAIELGERLTGMAEQKVNPGYGRVGFEEKAPKQRQKVYEDIFDEYEFNLQPFMKGPAGQFFDESIWTQAHEEAAAARAQIEKEKQKRIDERIERGIIADRNWQSQVSYAGGGMVGDKSGPPPESGPMSQGLRSLYNNVRKR